MQKVISFLGSIEKSPKSGKSFLKMKFIGDGEEYSAWEKTATFAQKYKVGDTVEVEISGKYVNRIGSAGSAGGSGGASNYSSNKSGGWKADPEKDIAVYTSYVLNFLKDKVALVEPKEVVKLVFQVRDLVKASFDKINGKLEAEAKEEAKASDPAATFKMEYLKSMGEKIGVDTKGMVWEGYIKKFKKNPSAAQLELEGVLSGTHTIQFAPGDGAMAIVAN